MEQDDRPVLLPAAEATARKRSSTYPEPFRTRVAGRIKQPLGDPFGLTNFGVNRTTLEPGACSALLHRHSRQDEFVYILAGEPTLVTDRGEFPMRPGLCAGFPAGGIAHQLVNRTDEPVIYLEVGDRTPGDEGTYPEDDLRAVQDERGGWVYLHKDGTPY